MEVPDTADVGASFEQQSQCFDIADAFSEICKIESGNHLNVIGPMRQEIFKRTLFDKRANDADLTGICANSRRQFPVPSCVDQPYGRLAHHAALSKRPLTACCQTCA